MTVNTESSGSTNLSSFQIEVHAARLQVDTSIHDELVRIPEAFLTTMSLHAFKQKTRFLNLSSLFYTDGSRLNGFSGFGVYNQFITRCFRLMEPCTVFSAEVTAILDTCQEIKKLPPSNYTICSDSMSALEALRCCRLSHKTNLAIMKIKKTVLELEAIGYQVCFLWVPAHCRIAGNEQADLLAKRGTTSEEVYEREIQPSEYHGILREYILSEWQKSWNGGQKGRWCHSILPNVEMKAWFDTLSVNRNFIKNFSRMISNHFTTRSHLYRINIIETNVCECGNGYEDIDHLIWSCERFTTERQELKRRLAAKQKQTGIPIRDVLGNLELPYMKEINKFLIEIPVKL